MTFISIQTILHIGTTGIRIYELKKNTTSTATWDTYNGTNLWTTAGGDFELTHVSLIYAGLIYPHDVVAGDNFNFPSSDEFANAVQKSLVIEKISLMVRTPAIDPSSYSSRLIYRFASNSNTNINYRPVLTVEYEQYNKYASIPASKDIGLSMDYTGGLPNRNSK